MAFDELDLVDSIAASPTVRLDLNSPAPGAWYLSGPPGLDPPELDRAIVSTMLADAPTIPAAAFDKPRTVVLPLRVDTTRVASRETAKATQMAALELELNRVKPILRWRPAGASGYTFYRLFRSPSITVDHWDPADGILDVTATSLAEPFGYGLPVTPGAFGTSDVPANANPYFESPANVTNWTPTGCTRATSTAQFHEGAQSMLVTPDGVTVGPHVDSEQVGNGSSIYRRGVRVTGWLRSPGTPTAGLRVNLYDASHTYITTLITLSTPLVANTWTFFDTEVWPDASNAVYAQVLVAYSGTPTGAQTVFADEVKIWMTGSYQVTDDPAAPVYGNYLDLTPTGDVETPLSFSLPAGDLFATDEPLSVFAVRRRGTVANTPFLLQAESMTLAADTSLPGNDATMSGSGSNYARTTFATDASVTTRMYLSPWPPAATVDNRGTYRVLACVRKTVSTDTVSIRFGYLGGAPTVGGVGQVAFNDLVTLGTGLGTGRMVVDLGLVPVPAGNDPVIFGYSGVEIPVKGRYIEVQEGRTSGTGNLDVDFLLFVPADDGLSIVDWGDAASGADEFVVDAPAKAIYTRLTTGQIYSAASPKVTDVGVMVSPGLTNRVYFVRKVGPGVANSKTATTALTAWYWPRYLVWAP